MKKLVVTLLIACLTAGIADAQLSELARGLGKKVGKNVKEKVESKAEKVGEQTEKAAQEAVEKVEKEAQTQVQKVSNGLAEDEYIVEHYNYYDDKSIGLKGDNLGMYAKARKTDWEDLQKYAFDPENWHPNTKYVEYNGLYYLNRWNKAIEAEDTEKMTGELSNRVTWCINQMLNMYKAKSYAGLTKEEYKQFVADYNKATKAFKAVIWAGQPEPENDLLPKERKTPEDFERYANNRFLIWNWCIDKAIEAKEAGKPITQQFYLNQVVGLREVAMMVKYLSGDEKGFAEFDSKLVNALKDTPQEFQNANKVLTPEECLAKQAALEEQWAKEEAEKRAKEQAEIEANTDDWPKSNMPELDAQILAIMKAKFPNKKIYRVSVMNNSWNVMMKGLVPERRVVQFWVEMDHESGRRIAEEHYVCQYYNGTYGNTQYQSQGSRYFWVRQN